MHTTPLFKGVGDDVVESTDKWITTINKYFAKYNEENEQWLALLLILDITSNGYYYHTNGLEEDNISTRGSSPDLQVSNWWSFTAVQDVFTKHLVQFAILWRPLAKVHEFVHPMGHLMFS